MCQIYKVLVDEKQAGKDGGAGSLGRYGTRSKPKRNKFAMAGSQDREKGKVLSFWLSSEIKKSMDL